MKKLSLIVLASLAALLGVKVAHGAETTPSGAVLGKRIPQFEAQALDVSGKTPRPSKIDSHKTKRTTVYIFVGTHCPATQAYAERLTQLEKTYGPKGVDFVYIYSNREDSREAKIAFHQEKNLKGRLIDDQGGKLGHLFGAVRTSELFVANPQGTIVYHGAIDDSRDAAAVKQRYLALALEATLAKKPIAVAESPVSA